jgi:hypothetical protein
MTRMNSEPIEKHDFPEQQRSVPQDKDYLAEKLRGAAVMYAPAVVLRVRGMGLAVYPTSAPGPPWAAG